MPRKFSKRKVVKVMIKSPSSPPTIQKVTVPRKRRYTLKRGQAYNVIKKIGQSIGSSSGLTITFLPKFAFHKDMRTEFFKRAFDSKGKLVKNSTFGSRFRSTYDAQDELLSTASVRHFIQGLMDGRTKDDLSKEEKKLYNTIVDVCSSLRIETRYSGFSTAKAVMQHPTAPGTGFFSKKGVEGKHSSLDSARVKYVGDALEQSSERGDSIEEQARVMLRAAIEFSLNYFTAPVTASNVHPFSTKKSLKVTSKSLLNQIAARERMKEIYVKLGKPLRELESQDGKTVEEPEDESLIRPWQRDLPITDNDPFPLAPPSPRRERRKKKESDTSPNGKVPLTSDTQPVNPFGSLLNLSSSQPQTSSSSSQGVQGKTSFPSNTFQQNTLSVGSVQIPKLNLGPVQIIPLQMPQGDVLPQAITTASRKRDRDNPTSAKESLKLPRLFEDLLYQPTVFDFSFQQEPLDPSFGLSESSYMNLGASCWYDDSSYDFVPEQDIQYSINQWDFSPSDLPLQDERDSEEDSLFNEYDLSLDQMLDQTGTGLTDFEASDHQDDGINHAEEQLQIIENNVIATPFLLRPTGYDMIDDLEPDMGEFDPSQIELPAVPTDNVVGDGIGGDLFESSSEELAGEGFLMLA